ncbi:MAG: hypothetical protein QM811_01705 [Pirellulales bacterium]
MVVVQAQGERPARILALDGWDAVCEFDLAGKSLGRHELKLPEGCAVSMLRVAHDKDGKRYAIVFHPYDQHGQLYLYDADWKRILDFPKPEDRGQDLIVDARLADLDGDGVLEIAVAYTGPTGMQAVKLDGTRLWRNRTDFRRAFQMAVGGPTADGGRPLYVPNETGMVVVLDREGEPTGKWQIPGQQIIGLFDAELESGKVAVTGVIPANDGALTLVGFTPEGRAPRGWRRCRAVRTAFRSTSSRRRNCPATNRASGWPPVPMVRST